MPATEAVELPPEPLILIAGYRQYLPRAMTASRCEVANRLAGKSFPEGGCASWISESAGSTCAYALMDSPDVTILVDACPRGGSTPGTVYMIEPRPRGVRFDGGGTIRARRRRTA